MFHRALHLGAAGYRGIRGSYYLPAFPGFFSGRFLWARLCLSVSAAKAVSFEVNERGVA